MGARLLDLLTCTCSVGASEPVHNVMRHYTSPYAVATLDREPDTSISVGCDAAAVDEARRSAASQPPTAVRTSHPDQRYRVWTTSGQQTLLPEHAPDHVITTKRDHVVVTAEQPEVAARVATRVLRQLIMRGGEVRGGRCVHAATVDIDGRGVLIGGRSGSGKTSVLTHLIESHAARPVANDRTMLMPGDGRGWQAVGVPLAWRFTPEGIGGSPTLAAALASFEPSRGRHLVDGKIELTPGEVSDLLDCPTVAVTKVKRIVILIRSHGSPLVQLRAAFVRQHLDFGTADLFAEDWLNLRPRLAGHQARPSASGDGLWSSVAEELPVLVLSWTDPAELPYVAASIPRWAART